MKRTDRAHEHDRLKQQQQKTRQQSQIAYFKNSLVQFCSGDQWFGE